MNKKGMYLATLSILVVFMMVMGYKVLNQKQEIKVNAGNIGKSSISILNGNIDGEKLKFFVEKSIEVSKKYALQKTKLNGGVYDKTNCQINGEYVVLNENCDYSKPEDSYYNYFKESFTSILKKYNEEYSSDDFNIEVLNGVLGIEGSKQIPLNVKIIKKTSKKTETPEISGESKYDEVLNHDNILEYIKEYSDLYGVPEDLIKAVMMQESGGKQDLISGAGAYGVMQITKSVHPGWFDGSKCNGDSAEISVRCNINAGASILKENYNTYNKGSYGSKIRANCKNPQLQNKFLSYTEWKAALRLYNGAGCGCEYCDDDYVESVLALLGQEISLYESEEETTQESGERIIQEGFGFITVNIDYEGNINYNFDNIGKAILRGRTIKNCVDNKEEVSVCASRETVDGYGFNAKIENSVLKFDVEEFETGDVIKFGLSI